MPRIKVTASVADGDERHGLQILVGDTVRKSSREANATLEVEDVDYDTQQIVVRSWPQPGVEAADAETKPPARSEGTKPSAGSAKKGAADK